MDVVFQILQKPGVSEACIIGIFGFQCWLVFIFRKHELSCAKWRGKVGAALQIEDDEVT